MAVNPGKLLSGDILLQIHSNADRTLPKAGSKDFTPSGSWLEKKQIQGLLNERKELIEEERVEKWGVLAGATWNAALKLAEVTKRVGKHFQTMGLEKGGKIYLYPEEALYLLETNSLELTFGGVPLSIQQGYEVLLGQGTGCTVNAYRAYSLLARQGYRLVRFTNRSGPTLYERTIRLDQHAPQKRVSPPDIVQISSNDKDENHPSKPKSVRVKDEDTDIGLTCQPSSTLMSLGMGQEEVLKSTYQIDEQNVKTEAVERPENSETILNPNQDRRLEAEESKVNKPKASDLEDIKRDRELAGIGEHEENKVTEINHGVPSGGAESEGQQALNQEEVHVTDSTGVLGTENSTPERHPSKQSDQSVEGKVMKEGEAGRCSTSVHTGHGRMKADEAVDQQEKMSEQCGKCVSDKSMDQTENSRTENTCSEIPEESAQVEKLSKGQVSNVKCGDTDRQERTDTLEDTSLQDENSSQAEESTSLDESEMVKDRDQEKCAQHNNCGKEQNVDHEDTTSVKDSKSRNDGCVMQDVCDKSKSKVTLADELVQQQQRNGKSQALGLCTSIDHEETQEEVQEGEPKQHSSALQKQIMQVLGRHFAGALSQDALASLAVNAAKTIMCHVTDGSEGFALNEMKAKEENVKEETSDGDGEDFKSHGQMGFSPLVRVEKGNNEEEVVNNVKCSENVVANTSNCSELPTENAVKEAERAVTCERRSPSCNLEESKNNALLLLGQTHEIKSKSDNFRRQTTALNSEMDSSTKTIHETADSAEQDILLESTAQEGGARKNAFDESSLVEIHISETEVMEIEQLSSSLSGTKRHFPVSDKNTRSKKVKLNEELDPEVEILDVVMDKHVELIDISDNASSDESEGELKVETSDSNIEVVDISGTSDSSCSSSSCSIASGDGPAISRGNISPRSRNDIFNSLPNMYGVQEITLTVPSADLLPVGVKPQRHLCKINRTKLYADSRPESQYHADNRLCETRGGSSNRWPRNHQVSSQHHGQSLERFSNQHTQRITPHHQNWVQPPVMNPVDAVQALAQLVLPALGIAASQLNIFPRPPWQQPHFMGYQGQSFWPRPQSQCPRPYDSWRHPDRPRGPTPRPFMGRRCFPRYRQEQPIHRSFTSQVEPHTSESNTQTENMTVSTVKKKKRYPKPHGRYFAPPKHYHHMRPLLREVQLHVPEERTSSESTEVAELAVLGSKETDTEEEDSRESGIMPLLKRERCKNFSCVMSSLQVIERADLCTQVVRLCRGLRIHFDIFLPNIPFKKTSPPVPSFHLCVMSADDAVPSASEISLLRDDLNDAAPLLFAVSHPDNISFFCYSEVDTSLQPFNV